MAKLTLTDLTNLNNQQTAVNRVNTNNAAIETAMENTLSRNGATPNQMLSTLDMNSNRIVNLPPPVTGNEPVRLNDVAIGEGFDFDDIIDAVEDASAISRGEVTPAFFDIDTDTSSDSARTTGLQNLFDYAATNGLVALITEGTWVINNTLRIPSNSYIKGMGKDRTTIKMASSVDGRVDVLKTGSVADARTNIILEDLTVDADASRWATLLGTGNSCGVYVYNTSNMYINRVFSKNAANNCFEIGSAIGGPNDNYASGEYQYFDEGCSNIVLTDCSATHSGDDLFVSHQSSYIWYNRCHAYDPGGWDKSNHNTNCFEVDAGSRNVYITDCIAERGHSGVQIKGHDGEPAPYNVRINGLTVINCASGVQLRHSNATRTLADLDTDHTGTTTAFDVDLIDATDATLTPGTKDDNFSPTAYGIVINNVQIIAPKIPDNFVSGGTSGSVNDVGGIIVQDYAGVIFNNISITDGSEDIGNKEYEAYDFPNSGPDVGVILLGTGTRRLLFNNLYISGFAEEDYGIRVQGFAGDLQQDIDLIINGVIMRNAPLRPIFSTSTHSNITINNYFISGDHISDGTSGINFGGAHAPSVTNQANIGFGEVRGYDNAVTWGGDASTTDLFAISKPVKTLSANGGILAGTGGLTVQGSARIHTAATTGSIAGIGITAESTSARDHILFSDTTNGTVGKVSTSAGRARWHPMATAAVYWTAGAGTPEGSITANIGSLWTDTTNGLIYVKNTGTGNTGWVAAATGNPLYRDIADQTITGGFRVTSLDLGTITTGTVTLDPGDRPLQYYINGGAHTLSPSANDGVCQVLITNNGSAGAITTSAYDVVLGDAFSTTNTHKFLCTSRRVNGWETLVVEAQQ